MRVEQSALSIVDEAIPSSTRRPVPARPASHALADGAEVRIDEDSVEVLDPGGRLLVRYQQGAAEISVPEGDLTLSAPKGRVRLSSGLDVEIAAARDVTHHAGRRLDLGAGPAESPQLRIEPSVTQVKSPRIEVESRSARLAAGRVTALARRIATTAEEIAEHVGRYELTATRLVERTRDSFREATGLAESRLGRARTLVKDVFSLHARRSVLASREETSIDGSKVLLG